MPIVKLRRHGKRVGQSVLQVAIYSCGVLGFLFISGLELSSQEGPRDDEGDKEPHMAKQVADQVQTGQAEGVIPQPPNNIAPGEMGVAYNIENPTEQQKALIKQGYDRNAFNQYVSDQISLDRKLPDMRPPNCKKHVIPKGLPATSVIICFHNEAWSVLLRSVHSVINRTPPKLLREIVLVDDASTFDFLKKQLETYMKKFRKVRIVRAPERVGLIRARILGAKAAVGEVLTFLDSHIETTEGWAEPLLDRIRQNSTNVVCPVIPAISDDTLEFRPPRNYEDYLPSIVYVFQFNWLGMPPKRLEHYHDKSLPFASPTMAGGLFAIDSSFFKKLGYYDPEFDIWGGENLELSFKTWMCGGRLEIVPCSHVGHIFRKRSPYQWRNGTDVLRKNLVRLAKVWTDEYAKFYFSRINNDLGDYGDISERIKLRENLQCKSFHWYLQNVYPEVFIPDDGYAYGEIQNMAKVNGRNYCLDGVMDRSRGNVELYPCHGQQGNQLFSYTRDLEIRREGFCADYSHSSGASKVTSYNCHGGRGNQEWQYDVTTKEIRHTPSGRCMTMSEKDPKILIMAECNQGPRQQWTFENYQPNLSNQYIDRSYLNLKYAL